MPLIYCIAGEQSGDVLGTRLITALRRVDPSLEFAGVGSEAMAAQGLTSLFPMRELAVMGLLEVVPRLRRLRARLRETIEDIARKRPDVVVTIDSPSFNLRVLKAIARTGIPRAHYVAPQVWAWRENRVRHFPGLWDRLLCLLPFEPAFFARHGIPATFVGHPVLESGADQGDAASFRARHGLAPDARVLMLMPGSRRTEVSRLLPIFGNTLRLLAQSVSDVVPAVAIAGPVAGTVRAACANWPLAPVLVEDTAAKHDAFAAASAALTKSGTSTLELAMARVPMAVTYRVNPLSAAIARRVVKVRYASLLNLLAEHEIVPELLQERCRPGELTAVIQQLLVSPEAAEAQRAACADVLAQLRPPAGTPSQAAAHEILSLLPR